ncbi:MAG TPA: thiamine pyrophosphate-dependent enzyme [Thermomicrobiaceae bacterium]|nr:thiamine pyrophosphate-dependent enzyme [Thermomicrobiaceae bacterium]
MTTTPTKPINLRYERVRGVHNIPLEEFYTSGHRTCQGCESATVMRGFVKAAGPRTVATGSTGCMYVANTSYMTTPWIIPWMHTQLGAGGSSAVGTAAGLRALMRKGKIQQEKINVISFCGDIGGGDMGLSGISGAMQTDLDLLVILYDNESAANTDIQATGMTTYGAQTTFTPPGTKHRIMQRRWKKNVAGMIAVGHPTVRYIGTACASYPPTDFLNKVRKALSVSGPAFLHTFDPCPKGWDYHPRYSGDVGELGIRSGIFPLYEIIDGQVSYTYDARSTAKGRIPVKEYLMRQGRFAHLIDEDIDYIQKMIDEMWEEWEIPGIAPVKGRLTTRV